MKRVLFRTLQIYIAFIACSICLGILRVCVGETNWKMQFDEWISSGLLVYHPFNTGILCLYIALLPWMLLLFVSFGQRTWWLMLAISLVVYAFAQYAAFRAWQLPRGWLFQPLAWQLPMVLAAILGRRYRTSGTKNISQSKLLFAMASLVLLLGLSVKKFDWLPLECLENPLLNSHQWTGKSTWGPIRGLHLLSLAYVIIYLFPLNSPLWTSRALEPMRVCGRHSLPTYCIGIIFTQIALISTHWLGNSQGVMQILVLDALVLQCAFAWCLSYCYQSNEGH